MSINDATVVIKTDRLVLRSFTLNDVDAFHAIASDPEVTRYISDGKPWPRDKSAFFVGAQFGYQIGLGYSMWAMELRGRPELIGQCGLMPLVGTDETEIGWWLARDLWGRGLVSEAAAAAMTFAMDRTELTRIVAIAQEPNGASFRIMTKIGMAYEQDHGEANGHRVMLYGRSMTR